MLIESLHTCTVTGLYSGIHLCNFILKAVRQTSPLYLDMSYFTLLLKINHKSLFSEVPAWIAHCHCQHKLLLCCVPLVCCPLNVWEEVLSISSAMEFIKTMTKSCRHWPKLPLSGRVMTVNFLSVSKSGVALSKIRDCTTIHLLFGLKYTVF